MRGGREEALVVTGLGAGAKDDITRHFHIRTLREDVVLAYIAVLHIHGASEDIPTFH